MKKRVRKVANFVGFNLLFFALYLNFIQQDNQSALSIDKSAINSTAAFGGSLLVNQPGKSTDAISTAVNTPASLKVAAKRVIN